MILTYTKTVDYINITCGLSTHHPSANRYTPGFEGTSGSVPSLDANLQSPKAQLAAIWRKPVPTLQMLQIPLCRYGMTAELVR